MQSGDSSSKAAKSLSYAPALLSPFKSPRRQHVQLYSPPGSPIPPLRAHHFDSSAQAIQRTHSYILGECLCSLQVSELVLLHQLSKVTFLLILSKANYGLCLSWQLDGKANTMFSRNSSAHGIFPLVVSSSLCVEIGSHCLKCS